MRGPSNAKNDHKFGQKAAARRRVARDTYEPPPPDEGQAAPQGIERQAWYQVAPPEPAAAMMAVGWTIPTYAIYVEALRAADLRFDMERDRRYAEVNVEKEKALKIKETADLAALGLAREIQTYKDEKANELREQISNERGLYASKTDLQAAVEKLEATLKPLQEFISSERGRSGASDPAIAATLATLADAQMKLLARVDSNTQNIIASHGEQQGSGQTWGVIAGVIAAVGTLVSIGVVVIGVVIWLATRQSASPPYVPAPYGTQIPSPGPALGPR